MLSAAIAAVTMEMCLFIIALPVFLRAKIVPIDFRLDMHLDQMWRSGEANC
jgi:hypothetical protein